MKRFPLLVCLVFGVLVSEPAYAYLDPGTGSVIIQGIIAGIAAVSVLGRLYWSKLKKFFGLSKEEETQDSPEESAD